MQLFNSVKIQQKSIQDKLREAGPLERKREKALKSINKSDFLELLGGNRGKTQVIQILFFFFFCEIQTILISCR